MKKYFYSDGKEKRGPFSFEELKNEEIYPNTLIWFYGLEDWTQAKSISELEEILQFVPPPISINNLEKEDVFEEKTFNQKSYEEEEVTYKRIKQFMFSRPFSFEGRIRRTEYGISFIIFAVLFVLLGVFTQEEEFLILGLGYIPLYWFFFAQGAKRCHDLGQNGWWQLIPLYPLLLVFQKGEEGPSNRYGRNPKL